MEAQDNLVRTGQEDPGARREQLDRQEDRVMMASLDSQDNLVLMDSRAHLE
jgi:hypothetical protein